VPSLVQLLAARWRDAARRGRRAAALRELVSDTWEFVKESTPERRRARFGDLEYDFAAGMSTTAGSVAWRQRLTGALAGTPYQPVDADLFRENIAQLPLRPAESTFIDLGSGKGRALLLAAEAGFRRVIGVELLPELHRIAAENVAKFRAAHGAAAIELHCGDARTFAFPSQRTVLFLFNPFPEATLGAVLDRFDASIASDPRPACVLYHNPVHEHVLAAREHCLRRGGDQRFCIYEWSASA
jgi:SAM-dependent methyltransferase